MSPTPKPGDWILILQDIELMLIIGLETISTTKSIIPVSKQTYLKVQDRESNLLIFDFNGQQYMISKNAVEYRIVSPKEHKNLEVLYG